MTLNTNKVALSLFLLCGGSFLIAAEEQYEAPTKREKPYCDYDTPTEYVLGSLGTVITVNVTDNAHDYWEEQIKKDGSSTTVNSAQILEANGEKRDYFGKEALGEKLEGDGKEHRLDAQLVNFENSVKVSAVLISRGTKVLRAEEEKEQIRQLIQKKDAERKWSEKDGFTACNYNGSITFDESTGRVTQQVKTSCISSISYDAFLQLVSYKGPNMHDLVKKLSQES